MPGEVPNLAPSLIQLRQGSNTVFALSNARLPHPASPKRSRVNYSGPQTVHGRFKCCICLRGGTLQRFDLAAVGQRQQTIAQVPLDF